MTKKNKFPTTLIIGIGGVGSRITMGIYQQFMDREPSKEDRDNFTCLCFDTDGGDIKKYIEVLPKEWVVQTSSSEAVTVGQYIDKIKDVTTVEDWFDTSNDEILQMKLNEGAGQVRMASRLAYMSAIYEGKLAAIDNSIRDLLKTDPARHAGNEIKVHIICSLAGGTGAGSFLQTAYYVKDVMRSFNIDAPKITGYFVLGDVLCHDKDANLNAKQQKNTRSNTYACMKEMNAFTNKTESQLIKDIEFEYKMGQESIGLPTCAPYDHCFMIDFTNTDGTNIGDMQVYYNQVKDFVYMNAFSPMGDTYRSNEINNILQKIEKEGKARFAALGVSKMVFPVDDLYKYFAIQRLVDNLSSTWIKIDKDFDEEYDLYKKSIRDGIHKEEPERGKYFVGNVESLAKNGAGWEGIEFKSIYDSTQELDSKTGTSKGPKSVTYLTAVEEYVKSVIESDTTFTNQSDNCNKPERFPEDGDQEQDMEFVRVREEKLHNFKEYALGFIETVRRGTIKQCFLVDAEQSDRVMKDTSKAQHHLNTHILYKDHELHPLAVRYFLYQVRDGIQERLEEMKEPNEQLKIQITETYDGIYDVKDDKLSPDKHVESATEALEIRYKQRRRDLNDFKQIYARESKKQRENIKAYAVSKLQEYVWEGLLAQVLQLIEESENFFKRLPDTIRGLESQCTDLLQKHDGKTDPTIMYVLASEKIKKRLYSENIKKTDSLMFPTDISARIYRSMFDNTRMMLEQSSSLGSLRDDEQAADDRERAQIEANNKLFAGVIKHQIGAMKKTSPEFMEMNILQALRMEGELFSSSADEAFEYMKTKVKAVRDMAVIRGAYNVDASTNRYINSWGINNLRGVSDEEKEALFGGTNLEPHLAAGLEPNPFYSQYELVRANSVNLLEVEKNFKGFSYKESNVLQDGHVGSYLKSYLEVDKRIRDGESDFSRHLDKRWQLPAYMPNLGTDMKDVLKDIFGALYYGLLFKKFGTQELDGEVYWYFFGEDPNYIADFNGWKIPLEGTENLEAGLNELFERGLIDNPSIVDYVMRCANEEWAEAKKTWQKTDQSKKAVLELMKEQEIIKRMASEMDYNEVYSKWNGKKWFTFMNASNDTTLARTIEKLRMFFVDDLIDRIVEVFEPSANTRSLCEYLFGMIPDQNLKNIALQRIDDLKKKHKFEKKINK